jgi:hypothetical protein
MALFLLVLLVVFSPSILALLVAVKVLIALVDKNSLFLNSEKDRVKKEIQKKKRVKINFGQKYHNN